MGIKAGRVEFFGGNRALTGSSDWSSRLSPVQ